MRVAEGAKPSKDHGVISEESLVDTDLHEQGLKLRTDPAEVLPCLSFACRNRRSPSKTLLEVLYLDEAFGTPIRSLSGRAGRHEEARPSRTGGAKWHLCSPWG